MANVEVKGYNPPPSTAKEKYTIEINLYFDGTLNNMNNTKAREAGNVNHKHFLAHGKNKKEDTSYYNDWSNVARLFEQCKESSNRIYVEGIGTSDNGGDKLLGYALGVGPTGVRAKVRRGCKLVADLIEVKRKQNAGKELQSVKLNVFGFSRGAAAARNFTAELVQRAYQARAMDGFFVDRDGIICQRDMPESGHLGFLLKQKGIPFTMGLFTVNFLGVFDTVSSHGASFNDDIAELRLNHLSAAKRIVHLTANDEIRENFSLTRVPRGIEKGLPGVHSDVGGSYMTAKEEVKEIETSWTLKSNLNPYIEKLVNEGWYTRNQLTITGGNVYWALQGNKDKVHKEYSYIPLHFMAQFSVNNTVPTNQRSLLSKYSLQNFPTLISAKENLRKYVFEGAAYPYGTTAGANRIAELHDLRMNYFHRSARRENFGMQPTRNWKRKVF